MYKEMVEYMAKSLVDNPDNVNVTVVEAASTVVLELEVGEGDTGRVIGKNGRVVNAMRTILQAAASRQGKRVSLEIL